MATDLSHARVLVTGAGGFTGRVLVHRLRAMGVETHGLSRRGEGGDKTCDLLDGESIARLLADIRPTHVFHLAAMSVTHGAGAAETYRLNVMGSINLLEALAAHADPRFVLMASSAAVYGPPGQDGLLSEDSPTAPISHYGISKLTVEQASRLYARRLPILTVRPFNYTGRGQSEDFVIPKIVAHFARRAPSIRLGNIEVFRDILDVESVVDAYLKLAAAGVVDQVVNVSSGRTVRIADVVAHLRAMSGLDIEVVTDPALLRPNEPVRIVGSNARLAGLIGPFDPPDIRDVVADMYQEWVRRVA